MLRFLIEICLIGTLATLGWTRSYQDLADEYLPWAAAYLPQTAAPVDAARTYEIVLLAPVQFALYPEHPAYLKYLPEGAILTAEKQADGFVTASYGRAKILFPVALVRRITPPR